MVLHPDNLIVWLQLAFTFCDRYAHRAFPSLVVHELEVMINQTAPQQSVVMDLFNNSGTPSSDINFQWLNPQVKGSVLSSGNDS